MMARRCDISAFLLLFVLGFASPAFCAQWNDALLYSFQGGNDGSVPIGRIVLTKQHTIFGATQAGGGNNCSPIGICGTIYQATPTSGGGSWTESVLYVFKGKQFEDGSVPVGGLISDSSGNLYGTTQYGGTGNCVLLGVKGGCGTVFMMSPPQKPGDPWTETILYSFKSGKDGYGPVGDLVSDSSGNLYGATMFGGGYGTCDAPYYPSCGTIFELMPPRKKDGQWTEKILYRFTGGSDGAEPNGSLILDGQGNLYGTAPTGGKRIGYCNYLGAKGCGTAFELKPIQKNGSWKMVTLYSFKGYTSGDGSEPRAGLLLSSAGALFGTTAIGGKGTSESGIVFELRKVPQSREWKEQILHMFSDQDDGGAPVTPVVECGKGNLWGTSYEGGQYGGGTVFSLKAKKDGSWIFSTILGLGKNSGPGAPVGPLIPGSGGAFFGSGQVGGSGPCNGTCGSLFRAADNGRSRR